MQRPMSMNGYSWVEGNVPNMVDPSGKTPALCFIPFVGPVACGTAAVVYGGAAAATALGAMWANPCSHPNYRRSECEALARTVEDICLAPFEAIDRVLNPPGVDVPEREYYPGVNPLDNPAIWTPVPRATPNPNTPTPTQTPPSNQTPIPIPGNTLEPAPGATPNPSTPIPTQQPSTATSTPMPQVNLDTSALTGLVAHNPKNPSETNTIRIDIQTLVGGNSMVATATALGEFNYGLTNLAGPTEQANAQALLAIVTPIADNPSARILAVPTTRAFGIDDRIIFGTGDNLAIATVTGNTRAVTYVRQFVPSFSALQHAPARFRENFV